jgi:UDP-N-acetylglucosamine/UDP-N-acetylgalactosamine diphosphorylase
MEEYKKLDKMSHKLKAISQSHLLDFSGILDNEKLEILISQIEELEFEHIPTWVNEYVQNESPLAVPTQFGPAPSYPAEPKTAEQQKRYAQARQMGESMIRAGKVAGFVVAGGQGTRLGFDGPKGNFPTSPVKKKTLFQLFAESLLAASKKYNTTIPWYIMTSPLNYEATLASLESARYFGLDKKNVYVFQQGTLPNFSFEGKILMADKHLLASSPDGHGGSLKALCKSGAVADMRRRGVEYLSYWQVDNPLIHTVDPLFVGLHVMDKAEMSSKALVKAGPLEKVGNFCLVDGKVTVIEYSDLPDEQALRRNPDGSLVFELGSIGIHLITVSFIERLNKGDNFALPFHRAVKKIPHIDTAGNPVNPKEPNGIKLETFVFDALPMAENSVILQTLRAEEFAPVKNATGTDSAEVTYQMMIDRAAAWLEKAGIAVPRKADGKPDCVLEIAASFALCADDVKAKAKKVPPIKPGDALYLE